MQLVGRRIVSNVFYYFLDFVTITLSGYVFWVLMGKLLPPEQYGIVVATMALFYIGFNITTFGIYEALPKLIAEQLKKRQKAAVGGMIRFSLRLSVLLAIASSFLLYLFAGKLSRALWGSDQMTLPLQLLALLLSTATVGWIVKGVLQGLQNFKTMFLADLVGNIARIGLAIGLVLAGWGALGGVTAWAAWFGIVAVICAAVVFKARLPAGPFDRRRLFTFSSLSASSLVAYFVILQGGAVVLSALSTMQSVGLLGVAMLVGQIVLFVPLALMGAVLPSLSELWVTARSKVQQLLTISIKATVLTVLPFTILFAVGGRLLIKLLYTETYLPAAVLFPGWLFGSFLFGISVLLLITLYAVNRPRERLVIVTGGAALNIVLAFALIPALGVHGAVLAFMTAQIAVLTLSLLAVNRIIPLSFSKRSLLMGPAIAAFSAILYLTAFTDLPLLKLALAVTSLAVYIFLLFALRVIGKPDLLILEYFPDRFGFGAIKRACRAVVERFAPKA